MGDIQAWIDSLEYEKVRIDWITKHRLPDYRHKISEWTLVLQAYPISSEKRGVIPHRPIGIGPMHVDFIDSVKPIVDAIRKKAQKYRGLGDPL